MQPSLIELIGEDMKMVTPKSDSEGVNQFEGMLRRLLGPMEEMWNRTEDKQYPEGKPPTPAIHPQDKRFITPDSINRARDPNRRIKT
jgi:hypothetical protein